MMIIMITTIIVVAIVIVVAVDATIRINVIEVCISVVDDAAAADATNTAAAVL